MKAKTPNLESTYITSDDHFGHSRIRLYTGRPHETVEEMDEDLIGHWNRIVGPDDVIYHLSDFTLGNKLTARRYFLRLNGRIRMLNTTWHHDRRWIGGEYYSASGHIVEYVPPIVVLESRPPIVLCHYPFAEGRWDRGHYGSYHLHGHSHGAGEPMKNALDVGVDNIAKLTGQYRPISLREAVEFIND